jgi:hypothetical protein
MVRPAPALRAGSSSCCASNSNPAEESLESLGVRKVGSSERAAVLGPPSILVIDIAGLKIRGKAPPRCSVGECCPVNIGRQSSCPGRQASGILMFQIQPAPSATRRLSGIPPVETGGCFRFSLQAAAKRTQESHRWKPVDVSIPAYANGSDAALNPPVEAVRVQIQLCCGHDVSSGIL